MIDRSWLTAAELEVLGAALDYYIGRWREVSEWPTDLPLSDLARWRVYVASELRHQLNTK